MLPFWASARGKEQEQDEPGSILPEEYAEDPDANRHRAASSRGAERRPLFPAGASSAQAASAPRKVRGLLPEAVVKTDPRKERQFQNRHIQDRRPGATSRAEELRAIMLRGTQDHTVKRGSEAFQHRAGMGYDEIDDLQPEGHSMAARPVVRRPRELSPSLSDGGSSDGGCEEMKALPAPRLRRDQWRRPGEGDGEAVQTQKKPRLQLGESKPRPGEDLEVDFF
ncbi:unnamed protein product [Polarella glacialis]|uniref:Uncharacterized protein n=1 Tax=Polarella glacialis TaxID=89957 RepID=A0A813IM64_POLGL|nr:unnamed protein product [Polarella glacialis]